LLRSSEASGWNLGRKIGRGVFEVRYDVPKKTDLSRNVLLTLSRVRVGTGEQIFKSLISFTKTTKMVCRSECITKIEFFVINFYN